MNRRIYLILLPIMAAMLSACGKDEQVAKETDVVAEGASEDTDATFDVSDKEQLYVDFLKGDRTHMAEGWEEEWFIPDFTYKDDSYEYMFLDLDGDDEKELLVQMQDDPGSYNGVFHVEDGRIVCWESDSVEMICYQYPLKDGTMVSEYDYGGSISYALYKYASDGQTTRLTELFIREEPPANDAEADYPSYKVDDAEVDKEEFQQKLKELILDLMFDGSDWTKL